MTYTNPISSIPGFSPNPSLSSSELRDPSLKGRLAEMGGSLLIFAGAHFFVRRHPLLFVSGFVTGILFDRWVEEELLEKVKRISGSIFQAMAILYFGVWTLPITLDMLCFGYPLLLGSQLSLRSPPWQGGRLGTFPLTL